MPNVDPDRLEAFAQELVDAVVPSFDQATVLLPEVRGMDPMLMVSVDPSLAAAHALASGYMISMLQGASECFVGLQTDLMETAKTWRDSDETTASDFK